MSYIAEKYGIEKSTVVEMVRDGVVDWRIEGLYDFWNFYNELLEDRNKRDAREEIMMHYRIEVRTFYRWIKKAKEVFN